MEKEVEFYGKRIKYYESGSGTPVVLLHGYLESSLIWGPFAKKLSEIYHVIAIDLPGHGQSETNGTIHSMEYMARGVYFVLEELNIGKYFLIGHSLGGYVALALVELCPEKISGYCLFHSHPFADGLETIEKRKREIRVVNAGKKNLMYPDNVTKMYADRNLDKFADALDKSKEIASLTPGDGIIAVLNGMMERPSRASLLESCNIPCLWLLGRMDNYINCDKTLAKINLSEFVTVKILEQSGHLGFIEQENESLTEVNKFIASVEKK